MMAFPPMHNFLFVHIWDSLKNMRWQLHVRLVFGPLMVL